MRTIIDVVKTVSGLIETGFGMPPTTKDIREGFSRPCFYVEPYQMRCGIAGDMRDDAFGIRIFYFSKRAETGYLDLLEKQTVLRTSWTARFQSARTSTCIRRIWTLS
ncbi:DUF6838 family protein [Oscillibacter sp.]|uniref:phage tail terminator family protein n=1 Tax=Oscillibacter sp. TaxID=1945593 RepID=UPI00339A9A3E